jgi:predicted 3-demethylubiquinone-9 3-methyltransferase (glyoxalase superfamily)
MSSPPGAVSVDASVFPNSKITDVARYGSAGPRPAGTVMTVGFELVTGAP